MSKPRVVIVGPPAAGKTKVGKRVAAQLGVPFLDTDRIIAERFGPIPELFANQGEAWFREREAEVIGECLVEDGVVSLGGGAVVTESTRRALQGQVVVALDISEDAVQHRLNNAKRPLLKDGITSWRALVEPRRPLYREVADYLCDVSHRDPDDIAREIAKWLEARHD